MLSLKNALQIPINIQYDHETFDFKTCLQTEKNQILIIFNDYSGDVVGTMIIIVSGLQDQFTFQQSFQFNQDQRKLAIADEFIHPLYLDRGIIAYKCRTSEFLCFYNIDAQTIHKGSYEQSQLQVHLYEGIHKLNQSAQDLFYNQLCQFRVNQSKDIACMVDKRPFNTSKLEFEVFDAKLQKIASCSVTNNQLVTDMRLECLGDGSSFVVFEAAFIKVEEDKRTFDVLLFTKSLQPPNIVKLNLTSQNLGHCTFVDAFMKGNNLAFICNNHRKSQPSVVVFYNVLGTENPVCKVFDLDFTNDGQAYPTILEIVHKDQQQIILLCEVEKQLDTSMILVAMKYDDDMTSFNLKLEEARVYQNNSLLQVNFGSYGYIEVPKVHECFTENMDPNEFQLDQIEPGQKENNLLYFKFLGTPWIYAYHYIKSIVGDVSEEILERWIGLMQGFD